MHYLPFSHAIISHRKLQPIGVTHSYPLGPHNLRKSEPYIANVIWRYILPLKFKSEKRLNPK